MERAEAMARARVADLHQELRDAGVDSGCRGVAAAFFNAGADPSKVRAVSAGTEPGESVHPEVVEVMQEVGFDLSAARPTRLSDELARGGVAPCDDGVR